MPSDPGPLARLYLPDALHPVVRLILARADLQELLGTVREAEQFEAMLVALADQNGLALDQSCLREVLRPDPLGLGRFTAAPVEAKCWPGPGWLPARSVPTAAEPAFDWLWFGPGNLAAPFFEDEVRRAEALPLNWLLRTRMPLGSLVAGASHADAPPISGLIFHMSRCGSTLLAQMLGAIAKTAVSSEPEPFDAVLRWIAAAKPPAEAANAAIQAMAAALGRRLAAPVDAHLIKLEVWHTFFLPELRAALPDAGWVYLHRDPAEVLVSQLARPGLHIVPGALDENRIGIQGFDAGSHIDYAAQVLGRCVEAASGNWNLGGGLAIGYRQIASGGAAAAAQHFGLAPDQADAAAMAATARRDAKAPGSVFVSDTESKKAALTSEIHRAADSWIKPHYNVIKLQ